MNKTSNNHLKISPLQIWLTLSLLIVTTICTSENAEASEQKKGAHVKSPEAEIEKGPHNGRLLKSENFALELSIFEEDVPPEFRVWASTNNQPINPNEVNLNIKLTRLGGRIDDINFTPIGNALRGDGVVYEPHSFVVAISATHRGKTHTWEYENFEGRTKIKENISKALEIKTAIAGSALIKEIINVYGIVTANQENIRHISARFDGTIKSVFKSQGDKVRKGEKLASIESNESLQLFDILSPINGVISQRDANVGEQSNGRQLFTLLDNRSVWVELSVFPSDLEKVNVGAPVLVTNTLSGKTTRGKISLIDVTTQSNQSVIVRVVLKNQKKQFRPGQHVTAKITAVEHNATLAVKRTGLQAFRDFTVVYQQIGEEYEVRMLELGVQAGEWAEVLSGLEAGARYVTQNSYVIKADIEKSGASHDH